MILECVFILGLTTGVITGLILFYIIFYGDMKAVDEFNRRQEDYKKGL